MSIHLESKDLVNPQQMEVAVHGPDGATHLILCTGVAEVSCTSHESFTFCVGPQLSRRQFVGAIASGAFSRIQTYNNELGNNMNSELEANLVSIEANYDGATKQVKIKAEVSSGITLTKVAISYQVSILAELPLY